MLELTLIPHNQVHTVYSHLVGYIQKSAEWTLGRFSVDDISAGMFDGRSMLWIVFDPEDNNKVHGYLTTEIRDFPQARHFVVLNCGGEDGSLDACVEKVFDTFEQYAAQSGCTGLEFIGRPAWAKFIRDRGYAAPQRQYFKKIGEE